VVKGCVEKGDSGRKRGGRTRFRKKVVEVEVEGEGTRANMLTNGLPFRGASHGCRAVRADRCFRRIHFTLSEHLIDLPFL